MGKLRCVTHCLETSLRCVTSTRPKCVTGTMPNFHLAIFFFDSLHLAIKTNPFKALYGRNTLMVIKGGVGLASVDDVITLNRVVEKPCIDYRYGENSPYKG